MAGFETAMVPSKDSQIVQQTYGRNSWEANAVSAHYNMAKVYDYYNEVLKHKSFDKRGAIIKTCINYNKRKGAGFTQAEWISNYFVFGADKDGVSYGIESALDIVAHEYTHAVIDCLMKAAPQVGFGRDIREARPLGEAYCDIMGSLIEGKPRNTNERWLGGEDCIKLRSARNMKKPSEYGYPEHYRDLLPNADVHINSTIVSFAAYKMIMDNDNACINHVHSGRTSNINDETWARVFYHSIGRLSANVKFLDARFAIISAAKAAGFTEVQMQAIRNAFDDVGIKEEDNIRIVLTWGETPRDLDSHLTGPKGTNTTNRFHIYFGQRSYYSDGSYNNHNTDKYVANIDYDCTNGKGPEITTIRLTAAASGDYYFYVHDYTNMDDISSNAMRYSGANVKVYKGSSNNLYNISGGGEADFTIENTAGTGTTLWRVFKINIGYNGQVTIEKSNSYTSNNTPSAIGSLE